MSQHKGKISAVAIAFEGLIITGGADGRVCIWDAELNHQHAWKHGYGVDSLVVDWHRQRVLVGCPGRVIQSWTPPDHKTLILKNWHQNINALALDSDSRILFASGQNIYRQDQASFIPLIETAEHLDAFVVQPEALTLLTARRSVLRYDQTGRQIDTPIPAQADVVAIGQNDTTLFVADSLGSVSRWSGNSGEAFHTLYSHPGRVTAMAANCRLLLSGCTQRKLVVWDLEQETGLVFWTDVPISSLAVPPDKHARQFVVGLESGELMILAVEPASDGPKELAAIDLGAGI